MLIKQNHIILQRETTHFVICHIEQKKVLNSKKCKKKFGGSTLLSLFLGLGLVHEGVEGVVEGVHEVGVVDWGLGALKGRGVVREEEL